uniref:Serine/threonine-protein kinase ATR n=1 Tax=Globodera rostochiensis TaxID=31243 RepID=A0A914GZ67_GLORO
MMTTAIRGFLRLKWKKLTIYILFAVFLFLALALIIYLCEELKRARAEHPLVDICSQLFAKKYFPDKERSCSPPITDHTIMPSTFGPFDIHWLNRHFPRLASPDVIFCDESFMNGQSEIEYIRRQIARAVIRKDQDKALFLHTRSLIKEFTKNNGETGLEFFQKNRAYFCTYLAQQMLETNFSGNRRSKGSDEPMAKSPRFDLFESWMEKLTKLFGFYYLENANLAISNFVENISWFLVPVFFLCRRRYKAIAVSLVDQICEIVRLSRGLLVYKHWDDIFEQWISMSIKDPTTLDIDVYLFHWLQVTKVEYFKSRTFRSMFRALLFLSLNEQYVLSLVKQIHLCSADDKVDGEFSLTMAIRKFFSNILFQFRTAITMVEVAERSKMACNSLEVLLERVDEDLINENAQVLLFVLKSAVVATGELCVSVWLKFVRKLRTDVFISLASQVIVFVSPLLKAAEMFSSPIEGAKVHNILLAMFDNNSYKFEQRLPRDLSLKLSAEPRFVIVKSCAELLMTGMVDLYQTVLERLLKVLEQCDLLQIDSSQLARALIFALHKVHNLEMKSMVAKCLGNIGLLDLDRTSRSITADSLATDTSAANQLVSVDNKVQFTVDFIHEIFSKLDECEHSETAVKIHCVIWFILIGPLKVHGLKEEVWNKLSKNVVEALKSANHCSFQITESFKIDNLFVNNRTLKQAPIIDQSTDFFQWARNLYNSICEKLEDTLLRSLFASLCNANHAAIVSRTMCRNFPHMIIQALIEANEAIVSEFEQETLAVFAAVIGDTICWAKDAMAAICCALDAMERFFVCRNANGVIASSKAKDKEVAERFDAFFIKILGTTDPNCSAVPLSVLATQKCGLHFRSLRWLEQFGPQNDVFQRDFYFLLERLYSHLGNSDGVLGTFQVIRNHTVPEPMEQILALKVQGNYIDALPLCQKLMGQEKEMVKCLLRSNQPLLARTFIEHTLKRIEEEHDEAANVARIEDKKRLREYQMEAVCKLGDWDQLAELQSNLMGQNHSDGTHFAGQFAAPDDFGGFERHFTNAQKHHKAKVAVRSGERQGSALLPRRQTGTVAEDHRRLGVSIGRTELLRVIDLPNTSQTQCRLLLKCSSLAREANYLQRSWTYIAEAKALRGIDENIAIDMEEAKYLFQKGEHFQAINLLEKAVHTKFSQLCLELSTCASSSTPQKLAKSLEDEDKTYRNCFVEAQMLLADFNERAGAKQMDDLCVTYKRLESFGHLSESFYYRYATFYDGYYESATEKNKMMVCTLLRLYRNVLEFGPQYVNHAIPRMLAVWFDAGKKCALSETVAGGGVRNLTNNSSKKGGKLAAAAVAVQPFDPNREMKEAFNRLDKAYFFALYSQMISRITHSELPLYTLLKEMLSELIVHFPHRCLWLSLSIARSTRDAVRSKRCVEIFELARKKARNNAEFDLNLLIQQFDYLATLLINIAETKIDQQRAGLSFVRFFPNVVDFFENGIMRAGGRGTSRSPLLGKGAVTQIPTSRPQILLPFIDDMFSSFANSSGHTTETSFSGAKNNRCDRVREVFIHGVDQNFECLKSLEAPKKMAFIGTDGRTYPLLCKQNDDLCKDARFMDVNRMLNTLFMRDSETRNQLYIRCYSTIPLKEAGGGIIQWIPNLIPFANALRGIMRKKGPPMNTAEVQRILGDPSGDRVKNFREKVCARHPLAMAQWLRTSFLDACSWYNARLAFTRTAATMSMVGFLLGLGDRHGENMLLDVKTGDLIHVDFNILFDKGEYLKVPEIVPFRLTRNMVDGFGATGVEGTFRRSCEKALRIMRAERRMLGTVLCAFAYDPLLEWTTTEARNQQYRQYGGTALQSQDNASNTIEMINMRLAGHIVTARFNPPKTCAVPMSVGGQVARLIEIATDDANLSAMYIGWSAFI